MGRLIFRAFRCEVELDCITVSRLLIVPVAKCLWQQELVSVNLSEFILTVGVCSAVLCITHCTLHCNVWLRSILRNWFVTSVFKFIHTRRAGLNEREAPGKFHTAKPPKRLAQLRSVSHALVSILQKHRSKTLKLIGPTIWQYTLQACSHGRVSGAMPPKSFVTPQFFAPRKICFKDITNTKLLPPKIVFCPFKS